MSTHDPSRREFVRKLGYVAPAIVTLTVLPAHQALGSVRGNNGVGNGVDPQPPGNPPYNDPHGSGPGNPANRHHRSRWEHDRDNRPDRRWRPW